MRILICWETRSDGDVVPGDSIHTVDAVNEETLRGCRIAIMDELINHFAPDAKIIFRSVTRMDD